jgi:hypothetical protein
MWEPPAEQNLVCSCVSLVSDVISSVTMCSVWSVNENLLSIPLLFLRDPPLSPPPPSLLCAKKANLVQVEAIVNTSKMNKLEETNLLRQVTPVKFNLFSHYLHNISRNPYLTGIFAQFKRKCLG